MERTSRLSLSRQVLGLAGWLLLTFCAAAIGGWASARAGEFYQQLARPTWAPPGWLFGPVWTILYLLMGIAAWLVWRAHGFKPSRLALGIFMVQLAANAIWSWIFFVWQSGAWAFGEILLLWGSILATIVSFWRLNKPAALLLLPYWAWVTFAGVLCYAIWRRNPGLL